MLHYVMLRCSGTGALSKLHTAKAYMRAGVGVVVAMTTILASSAFRVLSNGKRNTNIS